MKNSNKNTLFLRIAAFHLFFFFLLSANENFDPSSIPVDAASGKIIYTEVVKIDGVSKNELFFNAKNWFLNSFVSPSETIQIEDKEDGKILGKSFFKIKDKLLVSTDAGQVNYTISIEVKDEKYKYEIKDFHHVGEPEKQVEETTGLGIRYMVTKPKGESYGPCEVWLHPRSKLSKKQYEYFLSQIDRNVRMIISHLKQKMATKSDEW